MTTEANDTPLTTADAAVDTLTEKLSRLATEELERAFEQQAMGICEQLPVEVSDRRRRKLTYNGLDLVVRVPRLRRRDGKTRVVPLFESLQAKPLEVAAHRRGGMSNRRAARVLGTSSSTVHRIDRIDGDRALEQIRARRFEDEGIVVVQIDGTKVGDVTVLAAIGIAFDGSKKLLDVELGPTESEDATARLVSRLIEHGINPGVLWTLDGDMRLRAGIRQALGKVEPRIHTCRVHLGRLLENHMNEKRAHDVHELAGQLEGDPKSGETVGDFIASSRKRMQALGRRVTQALDNDDAHVARARLEAVEADLRAGGDEAAANSLRNATDESLTAMELEIPRKARHAIDQTNPIEAWFSVYERQTAEHTRWINEGGMHERWLALSLFHAEQHAHRVADGPELVALARRLGVRLPPSLETRLAPVLTVSEQRVSPDDAEAAGGMAATMLQARDPPGEGGSGMRWMGAQGALELLGLTADEPVTTESLAQALNGRHADTGERIRRATRKRDPDGEQREGPDGVLRWRLVASPPLAELWSSANPGRRMEIEQALLHGAETALERLTSSDKPDRGVVAAARVRASRQGPDRESVLGVDGVVLGVRAGRDRLSVPVTQVALSSKRRFESEDHAKALLNASLFGVEVGSERDRAGEWADLVQWANEPPGPARDSLKEQREYLRGWRAKHVGEQAKDVQLAIGEKSDAWLRATARYVGDPFANLKRDSRDVRATLTLEAQIAKAAQQRERTTDWHTVASLEDQLRAWRQELKDRRPALDDWMKNYSERAAYVIAIEREAGRRELELDWPKLAAEAARGRTERATLLKPYRSTLGDVTCNELAQAAEWPAAGLPDCEGTWLQDELDALGSPLEQAAAEWRTLRGVGDGEREREPMSEGDRRDSVRWLALAGEINARSVEQARQADAERELVAVGSTGTDMTM